MFTGHIREIGAVVAADQDHIAVSAPLASAAACGAFCVNGVGLRAASSARADGVLEAAVSTDTRRRSTLGQLRPGMRVNVETPPETGGRLLFSQERRHSAR